MRHDRSGAAAVTTGPGSTRVRTAHELAARPVEPSTWTVRTSVTAWCVTCGTEVDFDAPSGYTPVDLAADERACVWCGEALVVSVEVIDRPRRDPSAGAGVLVG